MFVICSNIYASSSSKATMYVNGEEVDQIRRMLNQLWLTWNLRVLVVISLLLQIVLLLLAPMRKRTVRAFVVVPVWLAYTLADPIAYFALGIISKTHVTTPSSVQPGLAAFWASSFLVFLGRPITATAFALEDNELWLRHLLGLGFPAWAVFSAFCQAPPTKNLLWNPTCVMTILGFTKYLERTYCLYLASSRRLKKSFLDQIDSNDTDVGNLDDLADIDVVSTLFKSFKVLIVDMKLSICMRNKSRGFFLQKTSTDAFNLVEEELKLFYGILYTKAHKELERNSGLFFMCVVIGPWSVLLSNLRKMQWLTTFDFVISLTLLFVVTVQEEIFSIGIPRLFGVLSRSKKVSILLSVARMTRPEGSGRAGGTIAGPINYNWSQLPFRKNWSQSISQYNLIRYCLHPRSEAREKIISEFGLTEVLDDWKYVETTKFTCDFRELIFNELKRKSQIMEGIETANDIKYPARGDWVLGDEGCTNLLPWINQISFDESIIQWHIATELCFQTQGHTGDGARGQTPPCTPPNFLPICSTLLDILKFLKGGPQNLASTTVQTALKQLPTHSHRGMSKNLSDYLMYLLIVHPTIMSGLEGKGKIRFRHTCAEVKKRLPESNVGGKRKYYLNIFCCSFRKCCCKGKAREDEIQKEACKSIQNFPLEAVSEPGFANGAGGISVLSKACELAKELNELEEGRKWKIICKVWVEMLCYAACRCGGMVHAAELSKGGQLITVVWLLMAHLGLGDHFEDN
ncbi:hypothetical protein Vadar_005759 [Vaccinium darrowii]|uniref:Uncharacterized protein n=1 Tax=Vaccinium darrowii TaxID=229202 RepID=A0ACB7WY27_9ERIC|nr:hypothetical protein Vadar_005759 [Vaccinium darrowii]